MRLRLRLRQVEVAILYLYGKVIVIEVDDVMSKPQNEPQSPVSGLRSHTKSCWWICSVWNCLEVNWLYSCVVIVVVVAHFDQF